MNDKRQSMNRRDATAQQLETPYADIICLPHYEPKYHPRMSADARAAQFAPFAALTGHGEAVQSATTAFQTAFDRVVDDEWMESPDDRR